eukprot:133852-Prorocentrum_minimum.AAC.1
MAANGRACALGDETLSVKPLVSHFPTEECDSPLHFWGDSQMEACSPRTRSCGSPACSWRRASTKSASQ